MLRLILTLTLLNLILTPRCACFLPTARSRELPSNSICGLYCWFDNTIGVAEPFRNGSHIGFHIEYIQNAL